MSIAENNYTGTFPLAAPPAVDMKRSYDRYFKTGLYDSRYPIPNPNIFGLILDELGPKGGRILDFGCGSGRYAVPLAQQPGVSVFAYDICQVATEQLSARRAALAQGAAPQPQLEIMCGNLDDLAQRLENDEGFDLVAALFGVLGHIEYRSRRVATLRKLRAHLRPGGRLIVTVPNRARRFLAEQKAMRMAGIEAEPGDVRYERVGPDGPIEMYYHLYTRAELCAELAEAGYAVASLRSESVLTERMVLVSPQGAAADRLLCRLAPVSLAYNMLAIARPEG